MLSVLYVETPTVGIKVEFLSLVLSRKRLEVKGRRQKGVLCFLVSLSLL